MKIAAIFTLFNGAELLQGAIDQIFPFVDLVLIADQSISNKGEIRTEPIHFKTEFVVSNKSHALRYKPDLSVNTKENERRKLNQSIQWLKLNGFTHFILLAVDHYYKSEEIQYAIQEGKDYDVTLTKMYTYFKHPTWQLDPPEEYYMPFICKIHPDTQVITREYDGFKTDPSVRINTRKTIREFSREEISLHHFSMVRNNVSNKFKNAAASIRWTPEMIAKFQDEYDNYDIEKNTGVSYFGGRKIKVVPNYFNIQIGEFAEVKKLDNFASK